MPFTKAELLSYNTREPILNKLNRNSYFDDKGCQVYTGPIDRCGYGKVSVGKRRLGAHKVMYILTHGDYDQSKYEMLHSCHNPSCINPNHLSHGTHKQNINAVIARGLLFGNGVGGREIKDKSVLLGSGGCGYRVCAESDEVCLLFITTLDAHKAGFNSGRVSNAVYSGNVYKGYKWKYINCRFSI